MSDNRNDMPSYVSGLALAINQTYSYASGSSLFISMIPSYLKDYGNRYIVPACQWLDGYVIGFHDSDMAIPSTRIATSLVTGITKNIVGEDLVFKCADTDYSLAKKTLEFVNNWCRENNIIQAVYAGIGFASALGTSSLKMNKTIDGNIWWEGVRLDNSFVLTDFKGEVIEATFNIRGYTDTRKGKNNEQYFLVEHRYYDICRKPLIKYNEKTGESVVVKRKGEKTPMVCYEVHRAKGTSMSNTMSSATSQTSVNWQELPQNIRDMIKKDYSIIRIKEPSVLGFIDLGVVQLKRGRIDLAVPTAGSFGESMIIKLISDFVTYEFANACRIRDMYLGKGNVYTPKNLSMGDLGGANAIAKGGVLHSMPDTPFTLVPGVDPDKQKVFSEQFQVRGEEWQNIMNDCLKTIATKLGMTPKVIAAYLAGGAMQQTATQIDSEDDQNIAFINLERSFYKNTLNKLLKTTLAYYGYPCNVSLEFASPSLLNKDRLLERVIKELDEGLIDVEEAVRTLNPDLEENAIRSKVNIAKFLHEQKSDQEMTDLDPFSELGNEI